MKVGIIVFSPTGNSRKIAEIINKNCSADILDITYENLRNNLINKQLTSDLLFFIFPVHAQGVPFIAELFIKNANINCKGVSIICTFGDINAGKAVFRAQKVFKDKGIKAFSMAEIPSVHSYKNNSVNSVDLTDFINKTILNLNSNKYLQTKKSIVIQYPQKLFSHLAISIKTDKNKCTECKKCISLCPAGAIKEDSNIDNKKCIRCVACVKYCSVTARRYKITNKITNFYLNLFRKPHQPRYYL